MPAPSILVDTNIVSYLLKGGEDAQRCAVHLEGQTAALSFQSVAELWYGAIKDGWGNRKQQVLDGAIRRFVVLACDEGTTRAWAELKAAAEEVGESKSAQDLWIAATAKRHGLPLLTNDGGFATALDIEVIPLVGG